MTNFLRQARDALATELERFRNRRFLEATMAASALVAAADGEVKFAELNVIDQAVEAVHELNIYQPHRAVDLYRDYLDGLCSDPGEARQRALAAVRRIAGDDHAARILIRVCIAIAKSDDDFSDAERRILGELCALLGIDASEMGI